MPELREVFEMTTKQAEPDVDAWREQEGRQRETNRNKKVGALAVATAIGLVALVVVIQAARDGTRTTPGIAPTPRPTTTAEEVATDFLYATAFFNMDQAVSYLADDADLDGLGLEGTREFRRWLSLLEAQGFELMPTSCEETGSSGLGTYVHCTFDFHGIRSDEIGRGPYRGSSYDLTVRDDKIVRVRSYLEISTFGPEMWDPFSDWVSTNYPEDAAVMYNETLTDYRLTRESIRLWEQRTREWASEIRSSVAPEEADHILDLDTGTKTRLSESIVGAESEATQYAASSDGSTIAFVAPDENGANQIFVADLDGSGIRQVTFDPMGAQWPAWSPDGTLIAYSVGDPGKLFILQVATGETRQATDDVLPLEAGQSQFTPDGTSLLYASFSGSDAAVLRTVPIDGGTSTVLIGPEEGMASAGNGSLSPDGSLVTMLGNEINGPGAARFVANADGTELRSIPGAVSNPAGTWSPDGTRIVCSTWSGDIIVVDIATGSRSRIAEGTGAIWLDEHTLLIDV